MFHGSYELGEGVFFTGNQKLGIVSVLNHVGFRGVKGEVIGKDLEEERAK